MSIFFSILFFSILFFVFHPLFNTYNYLNDDSNDQNIYKNNLLNQMLLQRKSGKMENDDSECVGIWIAVTAP